MGRFYKKWFQKVVILFPWLLFMWIASEILGYWLRFPIVILGFVSMWSLWVAREKRGDNWTDKTKNIWLCHMVFVVSSVMANVQLFYRKAPPTFGVLVLTYALYLTIRGTFNNKERYTINYTGLYTKQP